MCQINLLLCFYAGKVLETEKQAFFQAYRIDYQEYILLVTSKKKELYSVSDMTQDMLHKHRLIIKPENLQRSDIV